jgi:hypothetical protein
MTVNYTTNLALGQPVTGTESGTWGDDVNNAVTSYLDIAIAGGLAVTVTTADVTLTLTQGTSSATNIGSTTAQYAILNVSGAMTAARNLILPSSSRQYVINNACTGGFLLTVKGSATSGVTLVNGEKAHVFWNGSDYVKVSNSSGAGVFSSITNTGLTSGRVVYSTTGGLETDSANLTFDGTNLTLLGGTANGVAYLNGSKVLTTGSALYFNGTNLGVGTNSPYFAAADRVNVDILGGTSGALLSLRNGANVQYLFSTGVNLIVENDTATGSIIFGTNASTERMRIDSSGNVGIGTTNPSQKLVVVSTASATFATSIQCANNGGGTYYLNTSGTADYSAVIFLTSAGSTQVGSIVVGATTTTYNITSDYRLKTVIGPVADSGTRIDALQPVEYTWNSNGQRTRGFLAHQFQEVYADSVTGTKDAVDNNGNPEYQSMQAGTAEVIADLVAEIQSLRKRLTALEST